jgi:hypothetical protein
MDRGLSRRPGECASHEASLDQERNTFDLPQHRQRAISDGSRNQHFPVLHRADPLPYRSLRQTLSVRCLPTGSKVHDCPFLPYVIPHHQWWETPDAFLLWKEYVAQGGPVAALATKKHSGEARLNTPQRAAQPELAHARSAAATMSGSC